MKNILIKTAIFELVIFGMLFVVTVMTLRQPSLIEIALVHAVIGVPFGIGRLIVFLTGKLEKPATN